MGKGKRTRAERQRIRDDTPRITIEPAPDIGEADRPRVSFHCQNCGLWWSELSALIQVIADGAISDFSVSSACLHCGAPVRSSASTTQTLSDGRIAVSPADAGPPDFDLDPRQPLSAPRYAATCAFCNTPMTKSNDSKEHVLGKWLRKVDSLRKNFRIQDGAGQWRWTVDNPVIAPDASFAVVSPPRKLGSKPQHPFYKTVKVCKLCNNGWMSDLESQIKPVLAPLINGTSSRIAAADRRLLALWATKTAIALEQDDLPSVCISGAQVRDIRHGRPARWCTVWAAGWKTPEDVLLRHDVTEAREKRYLQLQSRWGRTWIGLGEGVAILVLGPDRPVAPVQSIDPGSPWLRVWPGDNVDLELGDAISRSDLNANPSTR